MATAYASLVSLMNVLIRIQHPSCPASFDQLQTQLLLIKVASLINFLEKDDMQRKSKLTEDLVRRMADAGQSAEDLIESYVVDEIQQARNLFRLLENKPRLKHKRESIKRLFLENGQKRRYEAYAIIHDKLKKVVQGMDFIIRDTMNIKNKGFENGNQLPKFSEDLGSSLPHAYDNIMVGFEDDLMLLVEKITSNESTCQIIPITGMGGIGKTTLATNLYGHAFVVNYFHVRAWVTVSQDYKLESIFLCLLHDLGQKVDKMSDLGDEMLGELLHKRLYGRKYLIVLDDIWSCQAFNEIMRYIPDNNNGSRIVLTTRLVNFATTVGSCSPCDMKFLDENKSWDLLSLKVFGQKGCPLELEEHGKKISKSCQGLPLAIVVMGGLLKTSQKTLEYWEYVVENIKPVMDMDRDKNCLKVLSLSYNNLPIHLKPCFLYLIFFPKGYQINVSRLVQMWIANGLLKPNVGKNLEEVALEYLNDLIYRNLIMVEKRGFNGKIKVCTVHDLFVDYSLKEAMDKKFLWRRNNCTLSYPKGIEKEDFLETPIEVDDACLDEMKLLRVLVSQCDDSIKYFVQLSNARFLDATKSLIDANLSSIPSSISLLWNLETLIVTEPLSTVTRVLPSEIWELPHLRHLVFSGKVILPEPADCQIDSVLINLQTLSTVLNFSCADDVVKRFPNLVKLGIHYDMTEAFDANVSRYFSNLAHLYKLETLNCKFKPPYKIRKCVFHELETLILPSYLRSLSLSAACIPWESMSIVGSLPNLEVLKLDVHAFCGGEWSSNDGEFQQLKYLSIQHSDLETWHAESSHFPILEHLRLACMPLKEIPWGIGEINTLKLLELNSCEVSAIVSAKEILEERKSNGDYDLQIQVTPYSWNCNSELMALADESFYIQDPTSHLTTYQKWCYHKTLQIVHFLLEGKELEELVSEISNGVFRSSLEVDMKLEFTKDALMKRATFNLDELINWGSSVVHEETWSKQTIQLMKEKILLNIEEQIDVAVPKLAAGMIPNFNS